VVFGGNVEKCKVLKKTGRISVLLSSLRFSAKIAAFSAILGYARSVKDPFIKRRGLQLNSLQAFFFGLRGWLILRLGFYLMLVPSASHFLSAQKVTPEFRCARRGRQKGHPTPIASRVVGRPAHNNLYY
jgi:hypothetical protein